MLKTIKLLFLVTLLLNCTSYEQYKKITEELEIPTQVFSSDFNQSWAAVIQVMKRFDLAYTNQEAGKIKTRWMSS